MGIEWALAATFALAGGVDTVKNYCTTPEGCLQKSEAQRALSISAGDARIDGDSAGRELYLRYELDHKIGAFQPSFGLSSTSNGDIWVGAGSTWTKNLYQENAYLRMSGLVGAYKQGSSRFLGSILQFRAALEIGYRFDNGAQLGVSFDHRSNADLWLPNPGIETYQIRYSIPF